MLDYEAFISQYYSNIKTEDGIARIKNFLGFFEASLGDRDAKTMLKDQDFLYKLFYRRAAGSVSRRSYFLIKSYISSLFDYYEVTDGVIPSQRQVISAFEKTGFFRSLGGILNFIDTIGNELSPPPYLPDENFLRLKGVCILTWYGVSLNEIVNLKTSSVNVINEKLIEVRLPSGEITIIEGAEVIHSLLLHGDSDCFLSRRTYFKQREEYLIKSMTPTFSENAIANMVRSFNNVIPSYSNKKISIDAIRLSSCFKKIMEDESNEPLDKRITRIINCPDRQAMHGYKVQYLGWLDKIREDKI